MKIKLTGSGGAESIVTLAVGVGSSSSGEAVGAGDCRGSGTV